MDTTQPNESYDSDRYFLQMVLSHVDVFIREIKEWARSHGDPEADDFCFEMEYIIGIGFVACQRYLSSTCALFRIGFKEGCRLPPLVRDGISFADAINATANYWKHHDGWEDDSDIQHEKHTKETLHKQEKHTKETLHKLGCDPPYIFVAAKILGDLSGEILVESLLPRLMEWRKNVERNCIQDIQIEGDFTGGAQD